VTLEVSHLLVSPLKALVTPNIGIELGSLLGCKDGTALGLLLGIEPGSDEGIELGTILDVIVV
jgi:hypothetical protein